MTIEKHIEHTMHYVLTDDVLEKGFEMCGITKVPPFTFLSNIVYLTYLQSIISYKNNINEKIYQN